MTSRSTDYALLSQASYKDPDIESRGPTGVTYKKITLDGIEYKPIAHADNPRNGFQATAYERQDGSHAVIIAYRGTEFGREPVQDGLVDAGMAVNGVNAQTADSEAFTKQVLENAKKTAGFNQVPPDVTVTGHSLGGTLAEINAYKFGLRGETFNAFGAAGLTQGIPQGGNQIIDNVRATDVVSAASPHFGQVRVYALPQDTQALGQAGYTDSRVINALTPHAPILGKIQADAHSIDNFVPNSTLLGHSILTQQNEKYAQAHSEMIQPYRYDIQGARSVAFVEYQIQKPAIETTVMGASFAIHGAQVVGHEAVQAYDATVNAASRGIEAGVNTAKAAERLGVRAYDATVDAASHGIEAGVNSVRAVEHFGTSAYEAVVDIASLGIEAGSYAFKTTPVALDNPANPDHTLYQQTLAGVQKLDAQAGRISDQHSANLAAALVVDAKKEGMTRIDNVALSTDGGSRVFAVQNGFPLSKFAEVPTLPSLNTPIDKSSAAVHQLNQQQAQQSTPPQMLVQAQSAPAAYR